MKNLTLAAIFSLSALFGQVRIADAFTANGSAGSTLTATEIDSFDSPWAMSFISDTQLLVTTKPGRLWLVSTDGTKRAVTGVPTPVVGGQGGLGDVVPHPDFATNGLIYLSYVESQDGGATRGAVVVRGTLSLGDQPALSNIQRVWSQYPHRPGSGHFSHKIAFGPKGSAHEGKLFITSGDRQEQTPAQRWDMALGKIIRLNDDGTVPDDNPFQDQGELARSFWTLGHRNLLGIAFDADNRLWAHEMGPRHGDELNLIKPGQNYGWPVVSMGDNYSGKAIPDHDTRPEFAAPSAYWVPSIAPSGLVIYSGEMFPDWQGNAFIGGLVSRALIRVTLEGETAREAERFGWDRRLREVEQGPQGALWVLEDEAGGRLLRLTAP
ncbi:Glucose/arabinose dehydrogenase, beta-propeller fold [Aliiroseovarius sediminilitoris]|uniref:Glucose/arabinose dehydrogenase, beta-propeller fold n=1 Tax=Aliiroseovarius sediminilitoris TaxID=1173584 RepID=A0A1I0PAV6_9RHOB|nr:PQQ-dependent sugar dehydrogenase [Aliiroseovarius sediminilitoris]SEW11364.1 Glucose/arabinose dehydrogenase, beta-propeller fold [Aliiroseovarius sediminilitoris]